MAVNIVCIVQYIAQWGKWIIVYSLVTEGYDQSSMVQWSLMVLPNCRLPVRTITWMRRTMFGVAMGQQSCHKTFHPHQPLDSPRSMWSVARSTWQYGPNSMHHSTGSSSRKEPTDKANASMWSHDLHWRTLCSMFGMMNAAPSQTSRESISRIRSWFNTAPTLSKHWMKRNDCAVNGSRLMKSRPLFGQLFR